MKLKLTRDEASSNATVGILSDGLWFCHTCEDVLRPDGVKVPGKTAIPAGTYEVKVTYSNRFKIELPILLNVPNFEGIRIHTGNTSADTEGCILVGLSRGPDCVKQSRAAFADLFPRIKAALARGEKITIEITNPPSKS